MRDESTMSAALYVALRQVEALRESLVWTLSSTRRPIETLKNYQSWFSDQGFACSEEIDASAFQGALSIAMEIRLKRVSERH